MSSSSTSAPKFPPCGPPSPAQMSSSVSPLIFPLCGPPSPAQVSSPSTRIPWPLMPPPQQPPPLSHQSSTMSYYQPMGVPPPFPYFSMPYPHDQFHSFHYPMIPGNNNNNDVSNGQIYSQPWSTGLFDCFSDLKNCSLVGRCINVWNSGHFMHRSSIIHLCMKAEMELESVIERELVVGPHIVVFASLQHLIPHLNSLFVIVSPQKLSCHELSIPQYLFPLKYHHRHLSALVVMLLFHLSKLP
ncbi:hypothetical protein HAX54_032148 [Datura stramonium]|uniref:Uncharacterized protein n=1 Tax=Datura stramonium TaxID=4076 RepID=A0ABS8SCE4_DATST|nr:hypothetical protein [Datura stramonium]